EQQLAIVRDVCRRRGAALMKRFDGILAVGTGYKKSDNAVSETICLGMLVMSFPRFFVCQRMGFMLPVFPDAAL
ncbi:hypothetical protein, partial [Lacticaseibacillus paracasei]